MESNFYSDKENEGEFPQAFEDYLAAKAQDNLQGLNFSEDEFEYVLDRLIEEQLQDQVLELSRLAFERYPYSLQILTRLCDTLIITGNPKEAVGILESYADSYNTNSAIFLLYSRANIAQGNFAHAREYFYKALECTDGESDTMESVCALAQDCIDFGNYTEALYYLSKAQKLGEIPYEYYNDIAFCHDRLDNPGKAEEYYNKYLDNNPFSDTVWFNMGTIAARMHNFDKAIEAFEYSIALNGENSSSLYNLAVVYMNLQRYAEAAKVFEQFNQIDPDELGRLGLGEAYIRLGKWEDARIQFKYILPDSDKAMEARAGLNALEAILCLDGGEERFACEQARETFKELFMEILNTGTAWLGVVYDMLPQLQHQEWFLNFLENIKKQ